MYNESMNRNVMMKKAEEKKELTEVRLLLIA